jgi:surfeit locus 1 family protein
MLLGLRRAAGDPAGAALRRALAWLLAIAAIAGAVALGNWQTHRAQYKLALQSDWDAALAAPLRPLAPADLLPAAAGGVRAPARVIVRGRFEHAATVWLDNRALDGRAGFWVVTPLVLEHGARLLVNRGWAPRDPLDRIRLPAIGRPQHEVELQGLLLAQLPRRFALGAGPVGPLPAIWQNLDFDDFERISGMQVPRVVLLQFGADDDGLARGWPRPDYGVATHRGYAVQWYALAALIAVLGLFHGARPWLARRAAAKRLAQ